MNLKSRPFRFLISSTLILALLATTVLAQNNKKKGFMGPPPPPPYNPESLARWAEVGPAKLARALHSASLGDVQDAIAQLDAAMAGADASLSGRLSLEKQRMLDFSKAREQWVAELNRKGKKIRVPVEGKMIAFKIASIADGKIVFGKTRKGVKDWAMAELSPGIMLTNLGKNIKTVEPAWLAGYLPSLAQEEFNASKLKGVDAIDLKQMGQYKWMLKLGTLTTEIVALSKAGYPEGEEELFVLLKRVGDVNTAQSSVPPLDGIGTDLRAYAGDLGKRAFEAADLTKLLRGKVTDLGNGRWKFVYEFDSAEEATDFVNDGTLFEYCLPNPLQETTENKSGWIHNEGGIAWAGRVGLYHQVSLQGEMVARYEWSAEAIGNTFDIQGGNLIFGLCAAPKELNFIGLAFVHTVWCYSRGQLTSNSNGPVPIYQKRIYKCELARDAAGTVTGKVNGKVIGSLSLPKVEEGPFFLAANLNIRGRLERLELEGMVQMDRLDFLRKQRAWEYLNDLGLAGDPPTRATE
jgi:hypothetical protein